jgi:phospholipase C
MDYFDGNTVTAYWNYAQNFAMDDNSFGSVPGPSTPGAINVVSGQTHGAVPAQITGTVEQGSVISDDDPAAYDFLSAPDDSGGQSGTNIPLGPPPNGYQGRFSFGPRLPFIVISPFAKENYVDHTVTDQSSIVHFIEDNWGLGRIGDFSFDQYSGTLLQHV